MFGCVLENVLENIFSTIFSTLKQIYKNQNIYIPTLFFIYFLFFIFKGEVKKERKHDGGRET